MGNNELECYKEVKEAYIKQILIVIPILLLTIVPIINLKYSSNSILTIVLIFSIAVSIVFIIFDLLIIFRINLNVFKEKLEDAKFIELNKNEIVVKDNVIYSLTPNMEFDIINQCKNDHNIESLLLRRFSKNKNDIIRLVYFPVDNSFVILNRNNHHGIWKDTLNE